MHKHCIVSVLYPRFPNYGFRIFKAFVSVCYQMYLFVAEEGHHFRVLGETLCEASIVSLLRGSYRHGNLNDRTYDVLQSQDELLHCMSCILLIPKCYQTDLTKGIIRMYRLNKKSTTAILRAIPIVCAPENKAFFNFIHSPSRI